MCEQSKRCRTILVNRPIYEGNSGIVFEKKNSETNTTMCGGGGTTKYILCIVFILCKAVKVL